MIKLGWSKKGDEKYYIITSMILGLIVLGLVFYFLFQEYFNEDEISWETCRQSILLRNMATEEGKTGATFKDKFPLKCKTAVVNINYNDVNKAEKLFADTLLSCFSLMGKGEYNIFPSDFYGPGSRCLVCARIHIDPKNLNFYKDNPINFARALNLNLNGMTYFDYLKGDCELNSDGKVTINCHLPVKSYAAQVFDITGDYGDGAGSIEEPKIFDVERGDILIIFSSINAGSKLMNSYLAYLQTQDIDKLNKKIVVSQSYLFKNIPKFCDTYEGIPA